MVCVWRIGKSLSNENTEKSAMLMLLALLFFSLFSTSHAIWLTLPPSGPRCISEEIHVNVVVLVDYVTIPYNSTISVKVSSPYGQSLHDKENTTTGNFAFTTRESGSYLACFWIDQNPTGGDVSVNIDWKTGIAAKDWDSVARREKIEGVELELRKLEGSVEAIHENLIYLKGRESEMRNVSETTNGRVAWFSIMSVGICIAVSVFQLWYLKRYFQKKKLI